MCNKIGQNWSKRTPLERACVVIVVLLSIILLSLVILMCTSHETDYCFTPACIKSTVDILQVINPKHDPCDNFYEFACGNFPTISREFAIESVVERQLQKNMIKYKSLTLEEPNVNDSKSLRLQKQYYRGCVNLTAIDEDDSRTFYDLIRRAGGWPVVSGVNWDESAFDLVDMMVTLRNLGLQFEWFLDITVDMDNSSLIEITYPHGLKKISPTSLIARKYVELMTNISKIFGAKQFGARSEMTDVLHFENQLANIVSDLERQPLGKNVTLLTIAEVQQAWQKIHWLEFLNQITAKNLGDNDKVVFSAKNYLPKLDDLLKTTRKRTQANYIIWKLIQSYSPLLSKEIRKIMTDYSKSPADQYPLWYSDRESYCYERAKSMFLYVPEAEFTRRYASKNKIEQVRHIVEIISKELERHLGALPWMDQSTKSVAISKLHNVSYIIGAPNEMYDAHEFDTDIEGVGNMEFDSDNVIKMQTEANKKGLDFLFASGDRNEDIRYQMFYNLVPSVQARFLRDDNILHLPAGILQELFYDDSRPNYLNYATIGTIIAHELTHSIDIDTSFDGQEWWSNSTTDNFREAVKCLENCNQGIDDSTADCNRTLLENLAEYAAINLAYEAYNQQFSNEPLLPGLNFDRNQLFWLAYGHVMCGSLTNRTDEEHTTRLIPSSRVIAAFRNSYHFAHDFKCPPGSNMNAKIKCQPL